MQRYKGICEAYCENRLKKKMEKKNILKMKQKTAMQQFNPSNEIGNTVREKTFHLPIH